MKKLSNLVLLPANESLLVLKGNKLFYKDKLNKGNFINTSLYKPQHLYFLSNEAPKENDWIFGFILKNNIAQVDYDLLCDIMKDQLNVSKIIATTNEDLRLPRPSNEFLKAYCEAYNSGKPITEVNIQYNDIYIDSKTGKPITYWGFETDMLIEEGTIVPQKISKLLVAPDNTITISRVEEKTYTREEVKEIFENLIKEHNKAYMKLIEQYFK